MFDNEVEVTKSIIVWLDSDSTDTPEVMREIEYIEYIIIVM